MSGLFNFMSGLFLIVLLSIAFWAFMRGIELRKQLKKTRYWKKLPKGTLLWGYVFPFVIIFSSDRIKYKFLIYLFALFLIGFYVLLVYSLNKTLKEQLLPDESQILPDDVRKSYIFLVSCAPVISASVFFLILYILDLYFNIVEYLEKKK